MELDFRLERPKEGGPFPVVFYVHGGGWVSGSKSGFTHQSFVLAENGIAGVRLEYRLKKHGAKYPEAISDVMDAIDYVRQHADELNIDFSRVGLAGGSAGGHLSAIAAQLTPECICYDGYNGLFDAFKRDGGRFGGGDFTGRTEQEKRAASAMYNIKRSPPDTFLYHGTKDTTVVIKQAHRFAAAIRKKGGSAKVLSYEGAGHAFFNREPYLTATTQALLAHTMKVFGLTDKEPVISEYILPPK
jgi:acetyl esterase/lipase